MTDNEKAISILTRDVAVIVSVQKSCQVAQTKTSENINKLVDAVNTLSHDTVYLNTLEARVKELEDSYKWVNRTFIAGLIGAAGTVAYHVLKYVSFHVN